MIHYHGTPCGGPVIDRRRFLSGRHALASFAHPEDLPIVAEVCQSFVLDNGAFTAWKQGGELDLAGYLEWVRQWHRHPACDWSLIPDVIDGTEEDNDRLIAEWPEDLIGYGVPVYHLHEPVGRLTLLASSWRTVAIGSSGQWPTPGTDSWWGRMAEVMGAVCDSEGRPQCRLHGLRMLNPDIFTRLPLASADSTNAVRNANLLPRFGLYPAPTVATRQAVIADRIEAFQSAAVWAGKPEELLLWE